VEITVMSGGAVEPGLDFVAAAFQKETGHAVRITYNQGAKGNKRIHDGEIFDVLVATKASIGKNFLGTGKIEEGGIDIGRVGVGMMVRAGAPVPDISSVEALKRAVLEAESVLYTEETSGFYIEEMLRKMAIAEAVNAKTERFHNGPALMDRVLKGKGREVGFLPINAIRTYQDKGVVLVGPLPEAVQYYLEFVAVPTTRTPHKEVAWQFARFCGGPGRPLLAAHGVA